MPIEIFPVVHVMSSDQAQRESMKALEAGADGVYLIDHYNDDTDLLERSFNAVAARSQESFIGLNYLQYGSALEAFEHLINGRSSLSRAPNGIWVDDARISMRDTSKLRSLYPELGAVLFLGGVAFKHTEFYTDNPGDAWLEAMETKFYVDVITTSGERTGQPPSLAKIQAMKEAIGTKKLAIASGIGPDNLMEYRDHFDQLLVSSSVETLPGSGKFNMSALGELIKMAHDL